MVDEGRKYTFWGGYWNAIESLPKQEERAELSYAMNCYCMTGEIIDFKYDNAKSSFMALQLSLKNNVGFFEKQSENGKVSKVDDAELLRLLELGYKRKDLADHFGVCRDTISKNEVYKEFQSKGKKKTGGVKIVAESKPKLEDKAPIPAIKTPGGFSF